MDADEVLVAAIKRSEEAMEAVRAAYATRDFDASLAAMAELDDAEDARERATVARGWLPAWPPRTPDGAERWGVTEEQLRDWGLAKP